MRKVDTKGKLWIYKSCAFVALLVLDKLDDHHAAADLAAFL